MESAAASPGVVALHRRSSLNPASSGSIARLVLARSTPREASIKQNLVQLDALVFGGGIAGLWALDQLRRSGRHAALVEPFALGAGQSVWSQGIIHGGVKYSLGGLVGGAAKAVSEMPGLWRACMNGDREPDLRGARLRAPHCHLWQTESLSSRLGMLGAKVGLRTAPVTLGREERPPALRGCPGTVARLDEPVVDVGSVLAALAARNAGWVLGVDGAGAIEFEGGGQARITRLRGSDGRSARVSAARLVLCAGAGNESLRERLGLAPGKTQRRPLHMAMARGGLPTLFGHCVDGAKTRVTITTVSDRAGRSVWQIGGQVAEDGARLDRAELVALARREVAACVPGLDLSRTEWSSYRADRAEAATGSGARPDDASVLVEGDVISAWPSKLALAPRLAGLIEREVPRVAGGAGDFAGWPAPEVAEGPWETEGEWIADAAISARG